MLTIDPTARTSMVLDIMAGRKTEIDALQGEVIAMGRAQGMDTPFCRAITVAIRETEAHGTQAPRYSPRAIRKRMQRDKQNRPNRSVRALTFARLGPQGGVRLCRVLGPGVFGITPAHVLAHIGIRTGPESGKIHSRLYRLAPRGKQRHPQRRAPYHRVGCLAEKLL
ncbi:MAG: hypothetical protein CSA70_02610 [Rhodobacterales bacterium]|nr:MAG: hypothetical protein CSA70_02610 [Rhodobacterales bacterium]